MAASSPTPSSGTISMLQIKNAHLNTPNASDLNSYRGVSYYVPGTGNVASYPSASSSISFDDFYNKIDLQKPSVGDQQINLIQSQYQIGGCAGGGVQGVNVRFISGVLYVYAGGFMADYAFIGSSDFDTTYGGVSITKSSLDTILNAGSGTVTGSGVTLGSFNRDTITLTALASLSNNELNVQIFYQCKGGTYPNTPGGKSQVQIATINSGSNLTLTWSNPT